MMGWEESSLGDWIRVAYQEHLRCDYMDGAAGLWECPTQRLLLVVEGSGLAQQQWCSSLPE